MKKIFPLLIAALVWACVCTVPTHKCSGGDYGPTDAQAKFTVRVVDEAGQPVEGAKVWARFNLTLQGKFKVDEKLTNAAGDAIVSGRCDLSTLFVITKDGYYTTMHLTEYRIPRDEIKDDKWQPYGSVMQHTLKNIHKPVSMKQFHNVGFRVPKADQEYGFDMEFGDLVAPYGKGKVADFFVKYTFSDDDGIFSKTLTISFPSCLDGACPIDLDDSFLKSPYHAAPDGNYLKTFSWKHAVKFKWEKDARSGKRQRVPAEYEPVYDEGLAQSQGLILRTRTKVDADGNLVSAHYGKIYGEIRLGGLWGKPASSQSARLFFNPVENDTNLECDSESLRNWLEAQKRGEPVGAGLYVL